MFLKKISCLSLFMALITSGGLAQLLYNPSPENLIAMEWFRDIKFGMFIHWDIVDRTPLWKRWPENAY